MSRSNASFAAPVIALLLALLASACSGGGPITLTTEVDDVMDMTTLSPVYAGDVEVGSVTAIELTEDNNARITMDVKEDTGLPAEVEALVMRASLLGERVVQLVPTGDSGELTSGQIPGEVQTDLEGLVSTGTDLLGFVAADRLSAMVHAGAVTFGGRGTTLGSVITDLETFVGAYDERSDTLVRLLDNLDSLLGTLAQQADTNAEALEALARSNEALREEDEHLIDSLSDLRELAVVGERILRDNRAQLDEFFAQIDVIVNAITGVEGALQNLLTYLPRHNLHVANGQFFEFVQIWQDTIVCGTSAARELRDNPAKSCVPPNPGGAGEQPPGTVTSACDERGEGCPDGHRTRNQPNDFGDDVGNDSYPGACDESLPAADRCPYAPDQEDGA